MANEELKLAIQARDACADALAKANADLVALKKENAKLKDYIADCTNDIERAMRRPKP